MIATLVVSDIDAAPIPAAEARLNRQNSGSEPVLSLCSAFSFSIVINRARSAQTHVAHFV